MFENFKIVPKVSCILAYIFFLIAWGPKMLFIVKI